MFCNLCVFFMNKQLNTIMNLFYMKLVQFHLW